MADNKKIYTIEINGVKESINAVDSLNKVLSELEKRIKALEGKSVKVNASSSSSGGSSRTSNASAMSEEEKLAKQIEQIDAKREAYSKEIYQNYLAAKDVLAETVNDQKQIAAQERLQADAYSNTMVGMKQKLADLKSAMQTVDLGDTDTFQKMTKEANELNEKLKEIEESYGQFGRNVGNYKSALEGVTITVNGQTRKFDSARQAAKELGNELKTMAANGQRGTEKFKELRQVVMELESTIKDAKKPMDNIMDSMEGIMAVANAGQGLRAFFGVDDAEIQKSIKNLVALQSVLKGIETINKQIESREGLGKWIAPFNVGIDKATKKLLVYNRALLGTSKAAKMAAVSINLFSKALKIAVSGGILIAVDLLIDKLMDVVESFKKVDKAAEAAKEAQEEVSKAYAEGSAKLLKYQTIVNNFNGSKKEEERLVKELNSELGTSLGTYKSIDEWMDVLTKKGQEYLNMLMLQAKAQAAFNNLVKAQQNQMDVKNSSVDDYRTFLNDLQNFVWSGWGSKSAAKAKQAAKGAADAWVETTKVEFTNAQKELQEYMKTHNIGDYSPQLEKEGKSTKKTVENVEAELAKARIAAMKEGLNKTILQLEEERKARLAKIDRNTKDYKQQEAQWNAFYNDRILEESEKWAKEMNKVYKDLYSSIASYTINNLKMASQETTEELNKALKNADDTAAKISDKIAGYNPFVGMKMSPKTQLNLGVVSFNNSKEVEMVKELISLEREVTMEAALLASDEAEYMEKYRKFKEEEIKLDEEAKNEKLEDLREEEKYFKQREALLNEQIEKVGEYKKAMRAAWQDGSYSDELFELEVTNIKNALLNEGYGSELSEVFKTRLAAQKVYWTDVERITKVGAEREKKARLDVMYEEQKEEDAANLAWRDKTLEDAKNYYKELRDGYDIIFKKGNMSKDDYVIKTAEAYKLEEENLAKIKKEYENRMINIEKKYETERLNIVKDTSGKVTKVTTDELNKRLEEVRDFQTQISNLEQKQPVMNAWGITNWKETKKNNQEIKNSYIELAQELSAIRNKALKVLSDKDASKEFKDQAEGVLREARNMTAGIGETLEELEYKLSNWAKAQTFFQDIQIYFQEVMGSLQTIMQAVWEAQDNTFDDEQDELDKWNEKLDKKLDEQQEIIEKHKSAIDSIEDELATARGDRRQHLIDQLNAEIAAQREARAEEKRIQKEKEAAEEKQDELEKKRKKAEYKRNMAQAIINGAMAVTMAAVNTWPIPAIPMMALAAATTAAQIAIMASNKPYAKGGQLDGGVAQGARHRDGGIPVLGGRASIEGGEFITNRVTTEKNIDVLDYINSKHKKLTLDDFIDFYGSGKVKNNIISSTPKRIFAEGGTLPTLRTDIDINDRLVTAMEDYSNRPVVVSVVDINNKQADVRRVQTLAGLGS